MIFAAGLGTRLKPLTDHLPKALVPVGGKPMLERVILRLKDAGCCDITINIHHFGDQIIDFIRANQSFGLNIHFSDERGELLDTGGGILKARTYLDGNEPFIVHNADILTDVNLREMYNCHLQRKAEATLLVSQRNTSRYLLFDDSLQLHGWINKSTGETRPEGFSPVDGVYQPYAFGGIHVFSPSLFHVMEEGHWNGKFSIIPFYLSICHQTSIQGYVPSDYHWLDIGKPETLAAAEAMLHDLC